MMTKPNQPAEPYTGSEILEALTAARNYNNWQARRIEEFIEAELPLADFGAGIGTFAKILQAHGRRVLCIEPDEKLREILQRDGLPSVATIDDCADASLPAVYTLNVLEHIEHDEDMLAAIYAKLSPGGKLLVYVPALTALWTSLDDKVCHYRRYHRGELRDKLRRAGFVTVSVRYADSLGALAALFYRWFADRGDGKVSATSVRFFDRYVFPLSTCCDFFFRFLFGKNVLALAVKPKC